MSTNGENLPDAKDLDQVAVRIRSREIANLLGKLLGERCASASELLTVDRQLTDYTAELCAQAIALTLVATMARSKIPPSMLDADAIDRSAESMAQAYAMQQALAAQAGRDGADGS